MRKTVAETTARVSLQISLFFAALVLAKFNSAALGQDEEGVASWPTPPTVVAPMETGRPRDPTSITTRVLGMTGWYPDAEITVTTRELGMTGWHRDPITITTQGLGMTGVQRDPITITTQRLGMTGAQRDPIIVTTRAFGMTGWADPPEQCSAPFMRDGAEPGCICPPGLLPSGDTCVGEDVSPPSDLRIEKQGPEACEADRACLFETLVTNVGAGPFRGPLVVQHGVNLKGAQISIANSGWSCSAGACVLPEVTLAPGESQILTVDVRIPDNPNRGRRLRHCTELKLPEPGDAPVRFVQLMLAAAGIDTGPADNVMGRRTRDGVVAFRRTVGLPDGAEIDEALIAALKGVVQVDGHPENDRSCTEARVAG